MRTTPRLIVLATLAVVVRYLLLPDIGALLPGQWESATSLEIVMLLVLYISIRYNTSVALSTAFWTGILADTLLLSTLGLRSLVFLVIAILPDLFRRYIVVDSVLTTWFFLSAGILFVGILSPVVEPGPLSLLALLSERTFWMDLSVRIGANTLAMIPILFLLDSAFHVFNILPRQVET